MYTQQCSLEIGKMRISGETSARSHVFELTSDLYVPNTVTTDSIDETMGRFVHLH